MRLLIVGASGMLGQMLFKVASRQPDIELFGTVRGRDPRVLDFLRTTAAQIFECDLETALDPALYCAPEVVVNCAGVIKQRGNALPDSSYVRVNALAPHVLAEMCERGGARLLQLSTDCVFSGRKGRYSEADLPDPADLYGRSKLLGEVTQPPHLTLRTSFIGFEKLRGGSASLLDWFMRQSGEIKGYRRAIWSGLTALELARQLLALARRPQVTGLVHLHGERISKYDLLGLAAAVFGKNDVTLRPDDAEVCDRSLTGARMAELGLAVPELRQMLIDLRDFA